MVELEPSSTCSSLHLSHRESEIQSQSLQKASSIRWDLYKPWAWALLAQSVLHVFLMDPPCRHRALSPKQWRERCTLEGNLRFSPSLFISFFLFLFSFFSFYFPLKEQREKWSSPRRRLLSEVTTPRSCSTRVSPSHWGLGAFMQNPVGRCSWWGGQCQGLLGPGPNLSPVTAVCRLVLETSNAGMPSGSHSLLGCGGHGLTPWHTG